MVGQEKLKSLPEENKEKIAECQEQRTKLEKRVEEEETNYEAAMANLKQETQVQCLVCGLRTPYMQKCQFFYVFTIRQAHLQYPRGMLPQRVNLLGVSYPGESMYILKSQNK